MSGTSDIPHTNMPNVHPSDSISNMATDTLDPSLRTLPSTSGATSQTAQSFSEKCPMEKTNEQPLTEAQTFYCSGKGKNGQLCGQQLHSGFKCCPICGTSVQSEDPNPPALQETECSGRNKDGKPCRFLLRPAFKFCPICATQVTTVIESKHLPKLENDPDMDQASKSKSTDQQGTQEKEQKEEKETQENREVVEEKGWLSTTKEQEQKCKDENQNEENNTVQELQVFQKQEKGTQLFSQFANIKFGDPIPERTSNREMETSPGHHETLGGSDVQAETLSNATEINISSDVSKSAETKTEFSSQDVKNPNKKDDNIESKRSTQDQNDGQKKKVGSQEAGKSFEEGSCQNQMGQMTFSEAVQNTGKEKQRIDKSISWASKAPVTRSGAAGKDHASVIFHVIISETFQVDHGDEVFIRCEPQELGTFTPQKDKNIMLKKKLPELGWLCTGKIMMTKDTRNKGFFYKYLVKRRDKGQFDWEKVHKKDGMPKPVNRYFLVPQNERSLTGDIHIYDGVAYPSPDDHGFFKSVLKKFGYDDFPKQVRKEVVLSGRYFLPSPEEILQAIFRADGSQNQTAEAYLQKIQSIMSSLKLQMRDDNLSNLDHDLPRQCLFIHIVEPILQSLQESPLDKNKRGATVGMFLLVLHDKNYLPMRHLVMQLLCRFMLLFPDCEKKTCPDLEDLEKNFPQLMKNNKKFVNQIKFNEKLASLIKDKITFGSLRYLADLISTLINKSDEDHSLRQDPYWLCCVPLLHFLRGASKPFSEPQPSSDFNNDYWWGIYDFLKRKNSFKNAGARIPKSFMNLLQPSLEADPLLFRTVVASLDFEPLLEMLLEVKVPLEITAATLIHHLRTKSLSKDSLKQMLGQLMKTIKDHLVKIQSESQDTSCTLKTRMCQAELAALLLQEFIKRDYQFDPELMLITNQVVFLVIDQAVKMLDAAPDGSMASFYDIIDHVINRVCDWMKRRFNLKLNEFDKPRLPIHLKMWDALIGTTDGILCTELQHKMNKCFSNSFEDELKKMSPEARLDVFLNLRNQVASSFQGLLQKLVFEALDEAFRLKSEALHDVRLISLLSDFLEQTWQQNVKTDYDLFRFVITWEPMVNYILRFGDKAKLESLGPKAAQHIRTAGSCINANLDHLHEGNIQIGLLQDLIGHKEQFLDLVEAVGRDKAPTIHLLTVREHELKAYLDTSAHINKMFGYCREILKTGDVQEVEESLRNLQNGTQWMSLSDVCKVGNPDDVKTVDSYIPKVNPWRIPEDILTLLPSVNRNMKCVFFQQIFSAKATKLMLKAQTFWQSFQNLWSGSDKEWEGLREELINGSISFQCIKKVFSFFSTGRNSYRYDELRQQLRLYVSRNTEDWVDTRIKQFQCYISIEQHVSAAKALLKVRKDYNISGKFNDIEKICQLSCNASLPVGTLDTSVLGLCKDLEGIHPRDINCLEEFTNPMCTKLVMWLKETMTGGLKELNVFVDLAFISAGEEPMAIARVNCLHAAATGYAPLIFVNITDCTTLLEQCRVVFRNTEADPDLPQKLRDSACHLDWFQHEEQSRGSVEKTSLSQVGNINECGIFEIGNAKEYGLNLNQVISLDVLMESDSKTPNRHYTYEELLDLQSRLMLVAGQAEKGKENVDRFISIMDSLMRLGKTYLHLCADGCILFLNWSVRFLCDVTKPLCCSTVFCGEQMLKGHRNLTTQEDVEQFIAGVANFLEFCHGEWLQHVDEKRKEYPELNIFTVEQLVFLQQQLVKVGSKDLSKYIFNYLHKLNELLASHLRGDVFKFSDILDAVEKAVSEIKDHAQEREQILQQIPECQRDNDSEELNEVFVLRVQEAGFSTTLARKALKEVEPSNIEGGIAWCTQHMDDDVDDDEETNEEDEPGEENSQKAEKMEVSVNQIINQLFSRHDRVSDTAVLWLEGMKNRDDSSMTSLLSNLRELWKKFLDVVSASGYDFLSLEHLGIVLRCLACDDERHFERSLPPDFRSGSPNLIICPKSDILNVVTYTYMFSQNDQTPLPQPDEVLLCTEDTSVEEVDIFLRRAFFSRQHKVFCMAYADYLDYDVEEKTEKKIQEYSRESGEDYHLVVICTTENEYKARIVAVLEKYRRPAPALSNKSIVQKFIHDCFSGLHKVHGMQSASALDPESLCVRVVKSQRSGVGKTLYKQRLVDQLVKCHPANSQSARCNLSVTIPLHTYRVQTQDVADILLKQTLETGDILPRIIHLDISYEVQEGVDHLLYNLLVLGCIKNKEGKVWLRSPMDLYLVEAMPLLDQKVQQNNKVLVHHILDILPSLTCWSPLDSLTLMKEPGKLHGYQANDRLFDDEEFRSEVFQRPFYYLHCMDTKQQPTAFEFSSNLGDQKDCLSTLLRHCGVLNPSWSELHHFVRFLNKQLQDFENSVYCSMATSQDLPGFSLFVLRFLIQMSRDFATRSLKMSEESLSALVELKDTETGIEQYELRRTWESSPHPYIFFNPDANSMTFLGFSIDPRTFSLMDQQTGHLLVPNIMNAALFRCLILNKVPLTENFDVLPRDDRLLRLYRVVGLHDEEIFDDDDGIIDPDDTYELTTDNVKKMLAIYLRFRCNIPVVIMGETGCGKTRLVEFLCALQTPGKKASTMVKVKVHGGTTEEEIMKKVQEAERMAKRNASQVPHRPVYTVLFFDEANTTEAIGVIKEIMCDGTLSGRPITLNQNLKIVAACNPYRKHSDELIKRLENAGLGYHIDANKTTDKLGRVPMRRLVYRVQPLPQSMLPLVWDFGQLNTRIEDLYIHQIVRRFVLDRKLRDLDDNGINVLCRILIKCQEFMRQRQDECSFVSLRDVTRCLTVASWFLMSAEEEDQTLFHDLDKILDRAQQDAVDSNEEEGDRGDDDEKPQVSDLTKALVLSLAVCYRACLDSKTEFDKHIVQYFLPPFVLNGDKQQQFFAIIDKCQDIFLSNVHLEENIACNQALKENVFMMVVCTELRIPLFLVGKPGSSKSLAKTIVEDAMQGISARTDFFRKLKQVKMVSFQCSPLATADGILATFSQCAQFQKGKKTDTFVSVVVLDEVGLAEDSPKMPLKTLHPLLEEGCPGGEDLPEDCRKVGFIGISNWALDPAKMNRGILVQRDVPDNQELEETARGICTTKDQSILRLVNSLIKELAAGYLNIFEKAKKKREFFGLRDFYSLVKMVYAFAAQSRKTPSPNQLTAAIRRNFGGLDTIDPVKVFREQLPTSLSPEKARPYDPDCSPAGLIKAALKGDNMGGESRYLLLLTENYGGLTILFDNLLANEQVVPIFGSSFPKDQEYTQICRNINRIKVCMEMGQTVILLNLENLYESLYDALNQYYAMFGGQRYVDLGLGTHRVKCRVHRKFRLIVVAEKQVVYYSFPIPLINRLEKHFLTLNNILTEEQLKLTEDLEKWAEGFANEGNNVQKDNRSKQTEESVGDVFMGYHPDTAAAIVLKVWDKLGVSEKPKGKAQWDQVLQDSKKQLLWCATPDAVVRAKQEEWSKVYNEEQQHKDLTQYLQQMLENSPNGVIMAQVTTHAKLLTEQERQNLWDHLPVASVTLLSLQSFDTEQQFRKQLETFFVNQDEHHKLLLVQSDCGDGHENLIKSAQYCIQDMRPSNSSQHHVVFIVQLPRVAGACFTGFLGGYWHCLHIDDLRTTEKPMPSLDLLQRSAPSRLLKPVGNAVLRSFMTCHNSTLMHFPDGQDGDVHWLYGQPAGDIQEMELYHYNTSKQHSDPGIAKHEQGLEMIFIQDLLTSCLQAAVALVRDQGTSRATCRVTILLKLLETSHEADGNPFLAGLSYMVSNIMEQKEREMLQAKDWLLREAAKIESVKKAGTWRQAWRQCLERKVIPILAGIIAYLDTNNNLDLLYHDDTSNSWMQQLWLRIFVHQGIDHLNYRNLQYMYRKQELQEFAVHCECVGAALFSARLPFSWILIQLVENALSGASESQGNLATTDAVVEQSPICQCLKTVLSDLPDETQKMFELYISDLLHFTFALTSFQHEVLYQSIIAALAQSDVNLTQLELGAAFVRLNKTLHNSKSRLHNILEMSACRPSAFESFVTDASHLIKAEDEMTQDATVLTLLVENLKPHPSQFEVEEERHKWVSNYNSIAPIITRIINEANTNNSYISEIHDEEAEEVEQKVSGGTVHKLQYERKCIRQLREVNCMWTRASAVKLFLDFTEPLRKKQTKLQEALKKDVKYQLLWTLLDDANLKTKKTLEGVDKFLKHANGHVIRRLLGKMKSCDYCDAKMESAPVKLPCSHIMCNSCWRLADNRRKCPQCDKSIPRDWKYGDNNDSKAQSELEIYQRQVSGFLMALVSQLCFGGQEPPEPEAVKHIFGYIIHKAKNTTLQTKQMMVVTDLIDPTPVLRSFLLRLLLRYKEADVMPHLEKYYKKSWKLLKQQGTASNQKESSSLMELSLLIMHCVEDLYQEQDFHARKVQGDLNVEEEAVQVCHTLRSMQVSLGNPQVELRLIWLLGQLRFMLNKCTDFIQTTLGGSRNPYLTSELKNILKAIMRLCQHTHNDWPKKFLIKELCQKFGVQTYLKLTLLVKKEKLLDWFAVEETEVQEVSDRYLVCDPHYRAVREGLAELKVSRDQETSSTQLKQILKNSRLTDNQQEQLLLLAVHREVSMSHIHQIPQQSCADMELAVSTFVQDCAVIQNKALAQQLCQNQLGAPGSPLYIHQGQDLAEQGMVCFLTHLLIALCRQEQTSHLLLPLSSLIHQPGNMTNSFLPTMPQDNLDEVLKAVGETPELYHCPNGHRYLVGGEGQCKFPVVEAACNVCGARIGGINHTPASLNTRDQRQDQTQTGHILGAAQHRAREALPERQLSPVECSVLRFLTHAALYLGASNPVHATAIERMIQPRITQQEVCPYFWNHLEHDLQVLCRAIGRSPDEAYLLLHYLCHQLTRDSKEGARQVGANLLNSKEERLHWERMFADKFIMPVIQKLNKIIKEGNQAIVADNRQGYSTLLQIVHEADIMTSRADNSLEHLPSSPAVWCYRPVITVEHFFRQFHLQIESKPATHTKHLATSLFRAESHVLRALHHVPAILHAQRRLLTQLCRRLDRAEAANLKIVDFMKDNESKGLADLFQPFCNAWEIVKERLITYRCLTPMEGLVSLPQEFHNYVITKDSPLAVLLPSTRGPGLCAYILLYYLLVQHNEFLHKYCKQTKQRYESLPVVEVNAIMEGHLVGYAPEELLPLVLSHCNYSLKLGESTNLEYDFEAFERHLIHSFMQCKSRVKRHDNGLVDIKTMVYTADTTSSRLFKQLREKINQESLSPGERRQIIEDLREDIPDISHSIDNLNITLRFLKAVHAQPETKLHKFMTDTLRMKTSVFSHKAQQLCCLKHIQSLWIVLCHQRASILSAHKEDAFDSDTRLQEKLTEGQIKEVKAMCQAMSVERLELLLLHLFECIMLRLSEPVDQEDDVNPENFVLHDVLESNLEYPLYQVEPVEVRSQLLTSQHLSTFPESLKGCHSKQTWLLCHNQLRAKRQQQQR